MLTNFLFKCPHLGLLVQGTVMDPQLPPSGSSMPYDCPACGAVHLVDPRTSEGTENPPHPDMD